MAIRILQLRTGEKIYENEKTIGTHAKIVGDAMRAYTGQQLNIKFHPTGDHIAEFSAGSLVTDRMSFSIEYEKEH